MRRKGGETLAAGQPPQPPLQSIHHPPTCLTPGPTLSQHSSAAETCFSPAAPSSQETSSVVDDNDNEAAISEHEHKSAADFAADTTTPPPRRNSNNSIRGTTKGPRKFGCFFFSLDWIALELVRGWRVLFRGVDLSLSLPYCLPGNILSCERWNLLKKNCVLFYSANRDHPVQGVRRQEFGRPLWSHHLWRLQGLLPEVAKFRRQLPMPAPKELRRRSRQPQPMPILSAPKMPGTRHVQRWQVSFFCTFMSKTRKLKKTRERKSLEKKETYREKWLSRPRLEVSRLNIHFSVDVCSV